MFYRIKPDIYGRSGILEEPNIPGFDETFMTGARLVQQPPMPLVFRGNFDRDDPPRGFEGMSIPVWSQDFVELLRRAGVDNFDVYPAVINGEDGSSWSNYYAVNVLGAVAAANLARSRFVELSAALDGTPLAGFQELVIDAEKVVAVDMFRLAESPDMLIVSERVTDALGANPRSGGWGITAFPIEEA